MPAMKETIDYTVITRNGLEETIACNRLFVAEGFVHFVDRRNSEPPYDEKLLLLVPADLIAEVRPAELKPASLNSHPDASKVLPVLTDSMRLHYFGSWEPGVEVRTHEYVTSDAVNRHVCAVITDTIDGVPVLCGATKEAHR